MILKLAGILIIITSCGYIGFELSDRLKKRELYLCGFIKAVSMSEDYISALSLPLDEIYKNLSVHIKILNDFFTILQSGSGDTYADWKKNLSDIKYLTDSDRKILLSMAKTLGKCDSATQINNLKFARKSLEDNLCDSREKIKSDCAMYKSIGIFTGIGIAVLLI